MINQIKYLGSWTNAKLKNKLGQRGAEMVEYAIVLACIAAVAVVFYSTTATGGEGGSATNTLNGVLKTLWGKVATTATNANN